MFLGNQITTYYLEGSENNVDLGTKYVTKSYLLDLYPYLIGLPFKTPGLYSWGSNDSGQCGINNITPTILTTQTQITNTGVDWKIVSSGWGSHVVAIKVDNNLYLSLIHI